MVSQVEGLAATVGSLELRPEHQALVAYCEGLAEAIDRFPERAALWREYRPALELLLTVGETEIDDGEARLLELVRTPLGDRAGSG